MSSHPIEFVFEVGGAEVTYAFEYEAAQTIVEWSTSEVILYLGQEGPRVQEGLRKVFSGS